MSDEEYGMICDVTLELGFRNVSELARAAMRTLVTSSAGARATTPDVGLACRIDEHDVLLRGLLLEIKRLKQTAGEKVRALKSRDSGGGTENAQVGNEF
jgi:hypothetical protein